MKLRIQSFFSISLFILAAYFCTVTSYYFFELEKSRVNVILKNINNNINELSYDLSKEIEDIDDLLSKKDQFYRIVANNDFIKAILILEDKKLLLSTNPNINHLEIIDTIDKPITTFNDLKNRYSIVGEIRYFENNKTLRVLSLIYVLEKREIEKHFNEQKGKFLIYLIFLPIIGFSILVYLLEKTVSKPLEKLREYAYDQIEMPKEFIIKELDAIRDSMNDSFVRLEKEKKDLYNIARTDSLSGLANRNSLNEFLERIISKANRNKREFAYLFLDIDHFKTINDSLGHDIGDKLLKNIAFEIKHILRADDFVARIGGDEFIIILQDYSSYIELTRIVDRIKDTISKKWLILDNHVKIGCSIGIAIFPKDGNDEITLMKNSDIAMYEAKKLGRNQYHFFTEELNEKVQKIISLADEIKVAIEENQFELYYQPKIDVRSSKIIGVEALIRWNHPIRGLVFPDYFIKFAEENDLIKRLDKWVILNAIKQYKKWKEIGIDLKISINISSKQLNDEKFISKMIELLKNNNVDKSKIDFEITEYTLLHTNIGIDENIKKLKEAGITLSLDDFGTGYSSLSYLKKFPIDYLKIDKSFLDDYHTKEGSIFIETIVKMAHVLNIKVVAEGVEEQSQLDYLKEINCDEYQGYLSSKPIKVNELEKFYFLIMS